MNLPPTNEQVAALWLDITTVICNATNRREFEEGHAAKDSLMQHCSALAAENAALRTQNAELVRALRECLPMVQAVKNYSDANHDDAMFRSSHAMLERITAALVDQPKENAV